MGDGAQPKINHRLAGPPEQAGIEKVLAQPEGPPQRAPLKVTADLRQPRFQAIAGARDAAVQHGDVEDAVIDPPENPNRTRQAEDFPGPGRPPDKTPAPPQVFTHAAEF